jgi:hypothetical protein
MPGFDSILEGRVTPNSTEAIIQVDFTGGLRIGVAGMELAPNEVRDCMNVDFPATGGVERRKAVMPLALLTNQLAPTSDVIEYRHSTGVFLYWGATDGSRDQLFIDGTDTYATMAFNPAGSGGIVNGTQVGDKLVLNRGEGATVWGLWDGSSAVSLRDGFRVDDYEGTGLPNFNEFHLTGTPRGKGCVSWNSRLWIWGSSVELQDGSYVWNAGTGRADWTPAAGPTTSFYDDTGTAYFSFAYGQREDEGFQDFYADWSLRFESDGMGEITKMVPLGERLFVFGLNEIHVITPNFAEPVELFYQVQEYRSDVGLVGRHAVATSSNSIWFFDQEQGLMEINAEGSLVGHMEKIDGLMDLLGDDLSTVTLDVFKGRVWVSVPENLGAGDPDGNSRTYVYDIALGAWTRYNYGVDRFHVYRSHSAEPTVHDQLLGFMRIHADNPDVENAVVLLDHDPDDWVNDYYLPSTVDGSGMEPIESFVATAWMDAASPEQSKDWVGAELFFRTVPDMTCTISAAGDWDIYNASMSTSKDVWNPTSWGDGTGLPVSFTGNAAAYTAATAPTYPAYSENTVLDATTVARSFRYGETGGVDAATSDRLSQPVRVGRICTSRAVSVRIEPDAPGGKWNLDRLTVFFERWLVRT